MQCAQSLVDLPALQLFTKFVLSSPVSFLSVACFEQDRDIDCVDDCFASAALGLIVAGEGVFDCVDSGASLAADDASSAVFGGGACARAMPAINTATVRVNDFAFIFSSRCSTSDNAASPVIRSNPRAHPNEASQIGHRWPLSSPWDSRVSCGDARTASGCPRLWHLPATQERISAPTH